MKKLVNSHQRIKISNNFIIQILSNPSNKYEKALMSPIVQMSLEQPTLSAWARKPQKGYLTFDPSTTPVTPFPKPKQRHN